MIQGIDVSHWEPWINWQQVLNAGFRFAFIKASQANYADPKFSTHWINAKNAGMPRGAYHYYDPSKSPEEQAQTFINMLAGDYGELPFIVDIEGFTSGKYHGSKYWYDYLVKLNQLSNNYPVMIYTAYYYWTDNVRKAPAVQDINYFGRYPLWVAGYDTETPMVPLPWHNWMFWQYSEEGIVPGVYNDFGNPTECDLDYFFGSEEQFQMLVTGTYNGGNTVSTFYKAIGNLHIRQGPGSTYPDVPSGEHYVLTGDIVETSQPQQNSWVKIDNLYRNDVKMAIYNPSWCSNSYLQQTTYTPPVTPPPNPIPTLTHTISVYSDGSLIIDGLPYP